MLYIVEGTKKGAVTVEVEDALAAAHRLPPGVIP
jgi:hypothetical protein